MIVQQHLISSATVCPTHQIKMTPSQFHPLQPIGENIHFFQPPPKPGVTSTSCPALITLCTWLGGATTQRIQKYISGYRALYPDAAILLITTQILEISALPFSVLHARLAPARDVIRRFVKEGTDSILLHIFFTWRVQYCHSAGSLITDRSQFPRIGNSNREPSQWNHLRLLSWRYILHTRISSSCTLITPFSISSNSRESSALPPHRHDQRSPADGVDEFRARPARTTE